MWVVLALVAVVVAAIVVPMFSSSSSGASYTTATVDKTTLNVTVSGSGNAVVSDVTEVQPGITGTVKGLAVKLGDTVQAGDLLFKITNRDLDAAVKRARASLTQARQQYSNSQASVLQAESALHKAEHPSAISVATIAAPRRAAAAAMRTGRGTMGRLYS